MIYILLLILIIIIIGYIFGLSLINTIDKKLNNINIDIKYPDEAFNNKQIKEEHTEKIQYITSNKYNFSSGEKINPKTNFDNEYYQQMNIDNRVEGFSNDPGNEFKEWKIENKKTHVCIKNHVHQKDGSTFSCTYGVTNYADPHDMSPMDLKIFNLNYPPNLTLQDYINWLYCFIDREEQLPYNHLKNLEKLKHGKTLIQEDGVLPPPAYYYPTLNAESYFDKMYNEINEFSAAPPLNSNTGPMLGYNYKDYSEFSQNVNTFGSTGTLRNTDIYKKKNAKKFYDYINPKDSNSINIDNENEIYRIKNVEV